MPAVIAGISVCMSTTANIVQLPSGQYELNLQGRLAHPHWVGFLFTGLAQLNISVVAGHATQRDIQDWTARFTLDFSSSRSRPDTVDFVGLTQRKAASIDMKNPVLSKFEVLRRADQGLEVRLEGPDQLGFLSRLLGRFSLLMLFPTEIEIRTVGGQVRDRLVFRAMGGTPPDESARQALEAMLKGFTG